MKVIIHSKKKYAVIQTFNRRKQGTIITKLLPQLLTPHFAVDEIHFLYPNNGYDLHLTFKNYQNPEKNIRIYYDSVLLGEPPKRKKIPRNPQQSFTPIDYFIPYYQPPNLDSKELFYTFPTNAFGKGNKWLCKENKESISIKSGDILINLSYIPPEVTINLSGYIISQKVYNKLDNNDGIFIKIDELIPIVGYRIVGFKNDGSFLSENSLNKLVTVHG